MGRPASSEKRRLGATVALLHACRELATIELCLGGLHTAVGWERGSNCDDGEVRACLLGDKMGKLEASMGAIG